MNKNSKASRCGHVSRNAGSGRFSHIQKVTKRTEPSTESAREFVNDFYKKHGKAMSQLANE